MQIMIRQQRIHLLKVRTHRLLREQKQQIMQMAVQLTDRALMAGIQKKSRKLVQPQIQAQQRMLQQIHRMTVRRIDGCRL